LNSPLAQPTPAEEASVPPHVAAPPRRALVVDTLADSVVILLVLTILQRGAGFVRGMLFCRWLTPEELGEWEMCFSFLMLAAPAAIFSLPGAFGRYLEFFRVRGQYRLFFRRTGYTVAILAAIVSSVVAYCAPQFSQFVFGRDDQVILIHALSMTLVLVIGYNYTVDLFTALRMQRVSSLLQVVNTGLFAVLGIGLLLAWPSGALSVVIAYGGAAAGTLLVAVPYMWHAWQAAPHVEQPIAHASFWHKLIPYALSLWATNWLANLFAIVDRYMIIHWSDMDADTALNAVGQYHAARLIPLLLIQFAGLLGTMLLPHLTHDWEAGRMQTVSRRLNLFLKTLGLAVFAFGVAVLLTAPVLFEIFFHGKYAVGLTLLPLTVGYCLWNSLGCVARTYLCCDERVSLVSVAYGVGLAVNVGLNLVLLTRLGLIGAVWSALAGNVATLALLFVLSYVRGLTPDRGAILVSLLPAACCGGLVTALPVAVAVLGVTLFTGWILSAQEKRELLALLASYRQRLIRGRKPVTTEG
jgi:O-antigen/teichoic acid export membrane protein